MSGERRWTIRDYRPGDEEAIITLFERVFGKPMGATESRQHWRWEYAANPVPPMAIKLAWDGDRLVAQHAASPVRMCVEGREVIACLTHDIMTDPEYKEQGLFITTANALYEDLVQKDVAFTFGFPNANSIHGFSRRLEWKELMPTPVLVRPVQVGDFIRTKTGWRLLGSAADALIRGVLAASAGLARRASRGIEIRDESAFGDWSDGLWQRCKGQNAVWVARDRAYLTWRYVARPESTYGIRTAWFRGEPVGWIVTTDRQKEQGKVRFVLDVLCDERARGALDALLASVEDGARKDGISFISALVTPSSWQRRTFLRHLFLPLPERMFPQELHFGCRSLTSKIAREVLFDPASWGLAWGDNDVL